MMDRLEKAIACTIHSIPGVGNRTLWKIKNSFGSLGAFFQADKSILYSSFLQTALVEVLIQKRKSEPEICLKEYESQGINVVCWDEANYPQNLRHISNPPYILYYQGELDLAKRPCIAIVGSRQATNYGRITAHKMARELAASGVVVVSGMARGIDSEAHRGALEGGKTIAVLGNGLDTIYPRENKSLFHEIISNGAVISEFPLRTPPEPSNFPMRNRIISGLSRGVIVVEAKEKSGALITTDFALEQGRDVFAVPGPINSKTSVGPNNLIKQGAKLITGIEDIIEEYYDINRMPGIADQGQLLFGSEEESLIIETIAHNSVHLDELIQATGLSIGSLSTLLFKLEMEGIIKSLPGNYYVRL